MFSPLAKILVLPKRQMPEYGQNEYTARFDLDNNKIRGFARQ
jgi:hypothetical protein